MTKTFGVDVSHWQGVIDWPVVAQNVEFCIMKATEGVDYVDTNLQVNKKGCIDNGIPWGAYHFFRPEYDASVQAEFFAVNVGDGCDVYVLDLERYGDNLVTKVAVFLGKLERLTGKKPMIYTSPGFWNSYMVPTPTWTSQYDLWVAHWGVVEPTLPKGWTSYVIHQYSEDGLIPGFIGEVDHNWFNGDLKAVWDYFGFETPEPPPPTDPKLVEVTATSLNMRSYPYGPIVGGLKQGNILGVTKTVKDVYGKDWYYSGNQGCFAAWWTVPYK